MLRNIGRTDNSTEKILYNMKKAELIEKLRLAIRRKHYSYATEKTYVTWAGQFFEFSRTCADLPSEERAGRFLDGLAPRVGGKTQHQALCALAFLFKEVVGKVDADFGKWRPALRTVFCQRGDESAGFAAGECGGVSRCGDGQV